MTFHTMKTATPGAEAASGLQLTAVAQRGKYIVLSFDDISYIVHLMQGGRLKVDEKQAAKVRGGLARWKFSDGRALLFTEAGTDHKAGVWVCSGDPLEQEPLNRLGPDADTVSAAWLSEVFKSTDSMRLHGWLREQAFVAGLGRRMANEICWHGRLSPFANTRKLTTEQIHSLHGAIGSAISEGLLYERSITEMSASKDRPGAVHNRTKQPCPRCNDAVRAVEYSSYTVNYCASCQTDGKVLADNTTSRFLK